MLSDSLRNNRTHNYDDLASTSIDLMEFVIDIITYLTRTLVRPLLSPFLV